MNLEQITEEVINRVMAAINQSQIEVKESPAKKFLQCDGIEVSIPGYEAVAFDGFINKNDYVGYDFLVISKLSIDEMAASVNGVAINDKTRVLRQFLLIGKNVYVIEEGLEYRQYKAIANPAFYKVFKDHQKQLELCGVRIMSTIALESTFITEGKSTLPVITKKETREESTVGILSPAVKYSTLKKLVNIELAKELATEPNIVLKKGTLVTPYAKDFFRESNATVTFI
ncbi:MAG: hypothetical protein CVU99_05950 [Firmicutes bacterium HGW-Firmicutes-4]|jgi:ethanolamine utilization protein|nr:MAG: hypothetical protein CVU99_05950 [Firmicutes bacterium HGW-Firmicutes-4]